MTAAHESTQAMTPERIMQVGLGFWGSKVLLSAVGLGLFTVLAREPLDGEALRARLGLHERGALDFFDALVALGFLNRGDDGVYSNADDAELFLDREKPSYIGGILEMANARLYRFWDSLTEALQNGEAAERGERAATTSSVRCTPTRHALPASCTR